MNINDREAHQEFSLRARIKSVTHAWRGIGLLIKTVHNLWGHIFFAILSVYLGVILHISSVEWLILVLTIGMVLATEAINSALEIDIDLTSPEYHPYARDTKDIAAGAVLIAVLTAIVVGAILFLPKIFVLL